MLQNIKFLCNLLKKTVKKFPVRNEWDGMAMPWSFLRHFWVIFVISLEISCKIIFQLSKLSLPRWLYHTHIYVSWRKYVSGANMITWCLLVRLARSRLEKVSVLIFIGHSRRVPVCMRPCSLSTLLPASSVGSPACGWQRRSGAAAPGQAMGG